MQANSRSLKTRVGVPLVATIAIAVVMILSNRPGRLPNGANVVESDAQYNDALDQVAKTSRPAVEKFNMGQEIEPADRDIALADAKIMDSMDAYRPDMEAGYYTAGLMYFLAGDSDTAEARLNQALLDSALPSNLKTFDDTTKVEAVTADCHHLLSLIAYGKHDYTKAIEEANLAIKHRDGREAYYFARAQAEVQLKQMSQARADLEKSLKINPAYLNSDRLLKFISH